MLCLFYENGQIKVLANEFPNRLFFRVISEKHMLYLDDEERSLSFEKDYEVLNEVYKTMHNLRGLNKCANDAYVSKIVVDYDTIYKGKTIYEWIKYSLKEMKNMN